MGAWVTRARVRASAFVEHPTRRATVAVVLFVVAGSAAGIITGLIEISVGIVRLPHRTSGDTILRFLLLLLIPVIAAQAVVVGAIGGFALRAGHRLAVHRTGPSRGVLLLWALVPMGVAVALFAGPGWLE